MSLLDVLRQTALSKIWHNLQTVISCTNLHVSIWIVKCKSFRSTSLPKGSTDDTRKSSGYERGDGKHTEIENARLLTVKHANTENVVPKSHRCLWGKYLEFMIITYFFYIVLSGGHTHQGASCFFTDLKHSLLYSLRQDLNSCSGPCICHLLVPSILVAYLFYFDVEVNW